jgi:manganese/zinc/iron transport system permease protein
MNSAQLEIQVIAVVVAVACAIPGTFLVLRRMAMISDAISHAILPGIVIGFFITNNVSSPILIFLAALTGVLTVLLVETINKTGLVKEDTAIGLVFPALFSIGVILISKSAGDVHIDTDAVLVGELAFAPFDRFSVGTTDIGPRALWVMGGILLMTIILLLVFFKELKLSTFDSALATSLGFTPAVIHYSLMSVTSITTVGAFDAVGAILVVALMIVPPAIAFLLTSELKKMLVYSVIIGSVSAISGYWLAHWLDVSISGSMTTVLGIFFLITYLFAPHKGFIAVLNRDRQQKKEISLLTFMLHIKNHSQSGNYKEESNIFHFTSGHFNWNKKFADKTINLALRNDMIRLKRDTIELTDKGLRYSKFADDYISGKKSNESDNLKSQFTLFRE